MNMISLTSVGLWARLTWHEVVLTVGLALPCRRKQNLQARTAGKLERRKEKREKKLLRPGFEGRRDSFIRTPSTAGKTTQAAAVAGS